MAKNDVTQTTKTVLSDEQNEILDLAMPGLRDFAATTPTRYQDSTVAPFTPAQTEGQAMALDAAGSQSGLAKSGADSTNFWLGGDVWNPESNSGLQGAIDAAVRPISNELTRTTLPAIRSEAVSAGGYGGSRQGIAEGLASGEASAAIADASKEVVNDNYQTNVNAQLKALGLLPTTQDAQTTPAKTTSAVGEVQQEQSQALIDEDVYNYYYDQLAPFLQSKELAGIVTGLPGGSSTTTANSGKTSGLSTMLGGASLGLSALLPFLSDRRLKENIVRVGTLDNGLPVYAFQYVGDQVTRMGLMADEVEAVRPEAVVFVGDVATVDYSKAVR